MTILSRLLLYLATMAMISGSVSVSAFTISGTSTTTTTNTRLYQMMDASYFDAQTQSNNNNLPSNPWNPSATETIQGSSQRTWQIPSRKEQTEGRDRVLVLMKSNGRPLHATVDVMQGPNYTPQSASIFLEDGQDYELNLVMELPSPQPYTMELRNTAEVEFPLTACVQTNNNDSAQSSKVEELQQSGRHIMTVQKQIEPIIIQGGGSLRTFAFDPTVHRAQVYIQSDGGRPFWCKIELLEGPNNIKQIVELYSKDGVEAPFFLTLDMPGNGNVVRIINTGPLEYPLQAALTPIMVSATT